MNKVLFVLLAFTALCSNALAQGDRFSEVCNRLIAAGWIQDNATLHEIKLDNPETPYKYAMNDDTVYAELLVSVSGAFFLYAFHGNLDSVDDLAVCITAYGEDDAAKIAQSIMDAYEKSQAYREKHPEAGAPSGSVNRGRVRYQFSHDWL
ncbi:MAG: hypothetical protein IKB82_02420, partial [Clostridia bacterium]|nr:hypothetical protein [Clostridia bacterium]